MGQAPIGPGFVSEVEAFLSDTGIGDRRFGSDAAGDPLFVRKLRSGASPLLSTVEQVQAWMRANRSAFEHASGAQGIRTTASSHCPIALPTRIITRNPPGR